MFGKKFGDHGLGLFVPARRRQRERGRSEIGRVVVRRLSPGAPATNDIRKKNSGISVKLQAISEAKKEGVGLQAKPKKTREIGQPTEIA
ncbi:hypothetical protein U1Q18_013284 [Sarracenia purpurea var. burkii]